MRTSERAAHITALANQIAKNAAIISSETEQFPFQDLLARTEMLTTVIKRRDQAFNEPELFSQTGWEILLQIFSAHLSGRNVTVFKVCEDTHLPMSTARRWLQILERKGHISLICRVAEPLSAEIQLTDRAISSLSSVIAAEKIG